MKKQTGFTIEPTSPAGWWKVVAKATGACMENCKGYSAALAAYRKLNKATAKRGRRS